VFITDKNDTFHFGDGASTGHFRLLALAMRRDELGNPVPVEGVAPAVSNMFVVRAPACVINSTKGGAPGVTNACMFGVLLAQLRIV
jgi:hypothetical protein